MNVHKLFNFGLVVKAIDSIAEVALGIFFFATSSAVVNKIIFSLFGDELTEQPRDAIWNMLLHGFSSLSASAQYFWAIIFLLHGTAKIVLLVGLIKKWLPIYTFSACVFGAFVLYQMYHIVFLAASPFLALLTLVDAAFTVLIIYEYKYQKKLIAAGA